MNFSLTNTQWKTLFGAVAAIASFLLTQSDMPVDPPLKVFLGVVLVALAVVNPNRAE